MIPPSTLPSKQSFIPRPLVLLLLLAMLATACSSADTSTPPIDDEVKLGTNGEQVRLASALVPFSECDELLDHLSSAAAERVGPWGLGQGHGVTLELPADDAAATTSSDGSSVPARASADVAEEFTATNTQELGVDEPDLIKTNGDQIVLVKDNQLFVFDVASDEPTKTHQVKVDNGWHSQLFITENPDKVYLLGENSYYAGELDDVAIDEPGLSEPFYGTDTQTTMLTEVTLGTDGAVTQRSLKIDGRSLSARLVGNDLRFVITTQPDNLPFVAPTNGSEAALAKAKEVNVEVAEEATLGDWLPSMTIVEDGEETSEQLLACEDVHRPTSFAGFGTLTVLSVDTEVGLTGIHTTSVLSEGTTVYASTDGLYVTTQDWIDPLSWEDTGFRQGEWSTSIHKFSTPEAAPANYEASGEVEGQLLNQFSMSEHEGVLRVASTRGTPWGTDELSESFISTFTQEGSLLLKLGEVGGMGKGERIYSVRYAGDIAYVVTFRQTDPFYTVDLADPTEPKLLGELKITGYSGYLQPISDTLVLGVGQEADNNGRTEGTKVTLFDVSDLTNPQDIATWFAPKSYTEAEHDHHAVLWWPQDNLLVLPLQEWDENFTGVVVLNVETDGADASITEVGRIDHAESVDGTTDCRQLTQQDIPADADAESSELYWALSDPGSLLLLCDPEMKGGATGHVCETMPLEYTESFGFELGENFDWGSADRLEWCWRDAYSTTVNRSLVAQGDLWTLSANTLQRNDIASLERLDRLPLR